MPASRPTRNDVCPAPTSGEFFSAPLKRPALARQVILYSQHTKPPGCHDAGRHEVPRSLLIALPGGCVGARRPTASCAHLASPLPLSLHGPTGETTSGSSSSQPRRDVLEMTVAKAMPTTGKLMNSMLQLRRQRLHEFGTKRRKPIVDLLRTSNDHADGVTRQRRSTPR